MLMLACVQENKSVRQSRIVLKPTDSIIADTLGKDSIIFVSEDFRAFYQRFIRDSAFQLQHIKFPLKGAYSDYNGDESWKKDQWPYLLCDILAKESQEDSTSVIQDSSTFFYGTYCVDCGFSFEMKFRKIKQKWFLTYRQENNY
jgi:hypothetical protein